MTQGVLRLKRAYEEPRPEDGYRILVDRLWPRGLSRPRAELDAWDKDVAPSPSLRTWWGHDPERLGEFGERYRAELAENPALDELRTSLQEHPVVTLVYGARDPEVNHAVILREVLLEEAPS